MKLVKTTTFILYLVALFWFVFAIYWLFRDSDYRYIYAAFAFIDAVALAVFTYQFARGRRWAYWLLILGMAFNVLVVIFDQIGWFDMAYLLPAVIGLLLLLFCRQHLPRIANKYQQP